MEHFRGVLQSLSNCNNDKPRQQLQKRKGILHRVQEFVNLRSWRASK